MSWVIDKKHARPHVGVKHARGSSYLRPKLVVNGGVVIFIERTRDVGVEDKRLVDRGEDR